MRQISLKFKYSLAILMLSSFVSQAQNQFVVTLTNGQTEAFNVSDIRSVKFVTNTMSLTENNGTQSSWNIVDVSQYAFSGLVSTVPAIESNSSQVTIFPNPISDNLILEYWSSNESKVTIELLDMSGKIIRSLFDGIHQGKQIYTWTKDLPGGIYYCRIITKSKIITKPFIIQ